MSRDLKFRLSFMMFLEYFVPGATVPILSLYLKKCLLFEPYQVGEILALPAIAAFFAPFIVSHIADRFLSSERLLALCHLLAAGAMVALSRQTSFQSFVIFYFLYGLVFTPTFGLTNAVALHHVTDPRRDFGGIRMWGTAGWVVVAWVFGWWWLGMGTSSTDRLPHAFYASALSSLALAAYSFTLPRSHVQIKERSTVMYWKALALFKRPSLAILCGLTVFSTMFHQVYYLGMSPFLNQSGYQGRYIMPAMSIGQLSEVFVLAVLWFFLGRVRMKTAMILGLLAQTVRYFLFAQGGAPLPVMLGICMHGFCYAFYFTTAYLYVDRHSTPETRAGAQQIFTISIAGFGTLAAYFVGGLIEQALKAPGASTVDYSTFWLVPTVGSFLLAMTMAIFFKEEEVRRQVPTQPTLD